MRLRAIACCSALAACLALALNFGGFAQPASFHKVDNFAQFAGIKKSAVTFAAVDHHASPMGKLPAIHDGAAIRALDVFGGCEGRWVQVLWRCASKRFGPVEHIVLHIANQGFEHGEFDVRATARCAVVEAATGKGGLGEQAVTARARSHARRFGRRLRCVIKLALAVRTRRVANVGKLITIVARLGQQRAVAVHAFGNAGVHQGFALRAWHRGGHPRDLARCEIGAAATNKGTIAHRTRIVAAAALVARRVHA